MKNGNLDKLYLIYGEEDYLKSFYAGKIAEKTVDKNFADFNLHKFEDKGVDLDKVSEALEAFPMMGGKTCVIVKDLPVDALGKDDSEKLMAIYSDVPDTSVLVFWIDTLDASPRKNAKWRDFIMNIATFGSVLELNRRSRSDLVKLVCSGAAKRGCSIFPDKADYLISLVGDDMTNLLGELEKVCAFTQNGEITAAAIDAVAVKTVEAVTFDLAKAIAAGNAQKAFSILNMLFRQKTEPVLIMGALISDYVDMYRVKICRQNGGRSEDVAKIFNYRGKEFRLRNAAGQAAKLTAGQLRDSLDALSRADEQLKSSGGDKQIILEKCITLLMLGRAAR